MRIWNGLWHWLGFGSENALDSCGVQHDQHCINPANGMPMVGGCGGLDIQGNPYGIEMDTQGHSLGDTGWQNDNWNSFDSGLGSSWDD